MDALRGLPSVIGSTTVQERRGSQQQADAFRKALQQEGAADGKPGGDERQAPQRPLLRQMSASADGAIAHHVDVIA